MLSTPQRVPVYCYWNSYQLHLLIRSISEYYDQYKSQKRASADISETKSGIIDSLVSKREKIMGLFFKKLTKNEQN